MENLNEMSPQWMVENFLPDFVEKWQIFCQREYGFIRDTTCGLDGEFVDDHFPEALQNFADRICEKQREICADAHINPQYPDEYENGCDVDCLTRFNIRESDQPKIEEL